ncbi:UCH-domain-containing protein [Myriangium duriaei CBS 260.36]|uniref:ubiquitinyl hydrolase 1 n=1 Tax=Myriangium duriaei CBS 260.36 TaxID=1168546 RepID=A0A9P4IV88_9PEZI|nr:UCH-domain-containing protein [Myriangium duriaei CBS 260.36]
MTDPAEVSAEPPNQDQHTAHADADLLDERVEKVSALMNTSILANEAGYVVSQGWLNKVYAQSTKFRTRQVEQDASQAPVGSIDNADIVPADAFAGPHLKFEGTNADFVPLKPQLERGVQFEVLPKSAWDLVVEWYGVAEGQIPIIRYAKDTAPPGSTQQNIVYELYPPVFTVRKMLSSRARTVKPVSPPTTSDHSQTNTRQTSPEQEREQANVAVRLLASRQDRFNSFLARSKRAVDIPLEHKVRPWRQLSLPLPSQAAIPTPAASRSTSPVGSPAAVIGQLSPSLVVDKADFEKMQEGTNLEMIDAKDNTANANYNGTSTLDLLGLAEDQTLILEEQIRGATSGEFVSDSKRAKQKTEETKPNSGVSNGMLTRGRTRRDGRARGTIGLTNLGNTCYMNSALQCISRIEELAHYFLANRYKEEINTDNPLGYNGRMAKAYADFLHSLYQAGAGSAYTPRAFKGALSQAQPMFSGYGQQDSQEFLSFLVDALHEDLNRIHKKPYLENPDSDDSRVHDPDYIKELGHIYRDNHRKRNDSIAMDLFNGFYKNTMVCPSCDKISVTFDPYSLLTLQLPIENTWQHKVFFVPNQGQPSWHMVDLDKNASIRIFKQSFATKIGGLNPQHLFVVETFQSKIYKVFKDGETVGEITSSDIILVFELPEQPTNISKVQKAQMYRSYLSSQPDDIPNMDSPMADRMAITVINRVKNRNNMMSADYQPMIIMLTRDEAKDYNAILRKILGGVAKITSRNFLEEDASRLISQPESRRSSDSGLTSGSESVVQVDGKLSDRSVPSEDEYVNVSMKDDSPHSDAAQLPEVLRPGSTIPLALRSLFDVKYFKSPNGDLHCAANTTNYDAYAMIERVQQSMSRRSSLASINSVNSGSTEASGQSAHSQATSNSEEDEASDSLSANIGRRSPADGVISDEDEAPMLMEPSPLDNQGRAGRRKGMPRRRKNQVTYGKKYRNVKTIKRQPRADFVRSSPRAPNAEDDPYYIKLGEGICLDWTDDGYDALFGGDPREPENPRGYMTLNENFMTLTKDEALEEKLLKRQRRKRDGVSLEDCFAETSKTETLSEENAWYCNRCKELRRADKTLMIWSAPDILVVHLKRFSGERYRRDKVDVLVDFPLEGLDLSSRVDCREDGKEYIYDLFAVDNHYGGLGGGHYTAYAKNFFNGKWYDFNDSFVSEQGGKDVVTPAAYLLFYRRRSATPLGPSYLQQLVQQARAPDDDDEQEPGEGRGLGDSSLRLGSSSASSVSAGASRLTAAPSTTTGQQGGGRLLLPGGGGGGVAAKSSEDGGWGFEGLDGEEEGDKDSTRGEVDFDDDARVKERDGGMVVDEEPGRGEGLDGE